jgi:hypothetical protein
MAASTPTPASRLKVLGKKIPGPIKRIRGGRRIVREMLAIVLEAAIQVAGQASFFLPISTRRGLSGADTGRPSG